MTQHASPKSSYQYQRASFDVFDRILHQCQILHRRFPTNSNETQQHRSFSVGEGCSQPEDFLIAHLTSQVQKTAWVGIVWCQL